MLKRLLTTLPIATLALISACDDKPSKPEAPATERAPVTTATSTPPAPKPPPDPLANLTVDELGPFLQGRRIDMSAKDADEQLAAAANALPVKQKAVPVQVARNAKTQHVGAVARALGKAGALEIDVTTPGRSGASTVQKLTPEAMVPSSTQGCAVVAMIKKDSTSTVWRLQGGTAAKFSRGMAGPDLSMTFEGMKKPLASCPASTWFFGRRRQRHMGFGVRSGPARCPGRPAAQGDQRRASLRGARGGAPRCFEEIGGREKPISDPK